jgi:hypothetical protein
MWRHALYNLKHEFYFKNKPHSYVEAYLNVASFHHIFLDLLVDGEMHL